MAKRIKTQRRQTFLRHRDSKDISEIYRVGPRGENRLIIQRLVGDSFIADLHRTRNEG